MILSVKHGVNYGLWVIMMCQCTFISFNKRSTVVRDVDSGAGYACAGQGLCGNSVPSSQFCCKPKTDLKKVSLDKKTDTVF